MKIFKRVLTSIAIIGLIASGFQITRRILAEQRNTNVELVADLSDFKNMATEMGVSINDINRKLISSGVNSIAISEETLLDMVNDGKILMYPSVNLKHIDVNFNNQYANMATQIKTYIEENNIDYSTSTVIFTDNKEDYDFLVSSFEDRFSDITKNFTEDNKFGILIRRKMEKIKIIGLGLTDSDFEFAKTLGFNNIIPRIENHEGITTKEVDKLYEQLKKYKVRTIVFAGVTVFGQNYEDENNEILKYIGEKFSQQGSEIITAIIEKPVETDLETIQRGINELSKASKYVNTKVYSVDTAQLAKISTNGLVEQWGRAISQRNVRVIYIRSLNRNEKTITENFEDTISAIREIKDRVNYMGMKIGNAKGLGTIKQSNYLQLLMVAGIIAAGFLLLVILFNCEKFSKIIYVLFGLCILGIAGVYALPQIYNSLGGLANKVFALLASIIYPSLAGLYLIYVYNKEEKIKGKKISEIIFKSITTLVVSILIAVAGGICIGGLLSASQFVLKLDVFRGVKLSFILPILIFGFAYVIKCGIFCDEKGKPLGIIEQAKKLLDSNITVKYGLAVLVVGLALLLVVMRSGNTLISSASSIELALRNFLEKYLVARPRIKELIAFPVLMFVVYLARYRAKELGLLAMAVAMIGIENVVNSFCHIRMPVLVTTLSTIYSLIFAVIIGSIGIVIIEKIINKLRK